MIIDAVLLCSTPQNAVFTADTDVLYILIYYIIYCLLLFTAGVAALYGEITQRYNVTMEHCVTGELWIFCELWITAFCCGLWIEGAVVDK